MPKTAGWQRPTLVRRTVLWPAHVLDKVEEAAVRQRTTFTTLAGEAVRDATVSALKEAGALAWAEKALAADSPPEMRTLYWEDHLEGSLAMLSRHEKVSVDAALLGCIYLAVGHQLEVAADGEAAG
ncbi:hypothetical protein [Streptomyces sp. NPDC023838]|uniref:hypothetical protein n=1 Tax=Streptomyces sp. NPDC023838 TaxID=3154325 RepID=UPI0033C3997A